MEELYMNRGEHRPRRKITGRNAGAAAAALAGLREAQLHHQAGRLDDAERGYQQLLARIPAQPDALHGLGLLLYRRGNLRDALTRLAQARTADARNPVYCFNHGVVLQRAGLLPDAVEAYSRAIELNPRYIEPRTNLGNVYKELGRLAETHKRRTNRCWPSIRSMPRGTTISAWS